MKTLVVIPTVEYGNGGYPSHIESAVIGFENFSQAEDFSEKVNGRIELLHKKDGWSNYERCRWVTSALDLSDLAEEKSDFNIFFGSRTPDEEEFLNEEVSCLLDNSETFDEFGRKYEELAKIWNKIANLADDEILIIDSDRDIIYEGDRYTMGYYYDTNFYDIGVIGDRESLEQAIQE